MSFAQPGQADSGSVPGRPPLGLSSNNPFRNRAASPISPPGLASPIEAPPRPQSRNPFLDVAPDTQDSFFGTSPNKLSFHMDAPTRAAPLTGNAAELFDNLTLGDKPSGSNSIRPPPSRTLTDEKNPPPYSSVANRNENIRPRPPPGRRPSAPEEPSRGHRPGNSGGIGVASSRGRPTAELDIFADPVETSPKKGGPRRNSESSVAERPGRVLSPEEEKERQERRRRERRHREKSKDGRPKKPSRRLDLIDKLDVTSIYGTGLFHHDGPFDACNPNRNRNGSRRAPMQAFPKDSLNNALGGGGPINKRADHSIFLGNNDEEAFKDYSSGAIAGSYGIPKHKTEINVQSAATTLEPIHGEESLGLGTSTFLEGAPASRTAMQRRQSESGPSDGGGLGRKKSLAQKIRGINNTRREYGPSGRITSPDGAYSGNSTSPTARAPTSTKLPERSPFSNDFPNGEESRKESTISFAEPAKSAGAPGSPGRYGDRLERRITADGSPESDPKGNSGGFLSRVKSLKGGPRRPKDSRPQLPDE